MSRSGYTDECENLALWRGAVERAIKGKRGQAFLREMLDALDALPEKRLIAHELKRDDGAVCALGSVGVRRGIDMPKVSGDEWDDPVEGMGKLFGIAEAMAKEIQYVNDEQNYRPETDEQRFLRVRQWVRSQLTDVPPIERKSP